MHGQRLVCLVPAVVLMATSVVARERVPEPPAVPDSGSTSGMTRIESTQDGEGTAPSDAREAPTVAEPEAPPAGEPVPSVITASATTGQDAGPAVMLRCGGADGAFTFGAGSDDFVAWALSPGPIDRLSARPGAGSVAAPLRSACHTARAASRAALAESLRSAGSLSVFSCPAELHRRRTMSRHAPSG